MSASVKKVPIPVIESAKRELDNHRHTIEISLNQRISWLTHDGIVHHASVKELILAFHGLAQIMDTSRNYEMEIESAAKKGVKHQ